MATSAMRDDILSAPMEPTSAGPRGGAVSIGTDNHRSDTDVMPTLARQGAFPSTRSGRRSGQRKFTRLGYSPFLAKEIFGSSSRSPETVGANTDNTTVACRFSLNNKGHLLCFLFRASGTRVLKAKGGADGDQISSYL